VAAGTPCIANGSACDGMGVCSPTFAVVRVGLGAAVLTNASTDVFVEERVLSGGALVIKANNPVVLPTSPNGSNRALTLAGNASSEGNLSLSANGSYLTLAGYDAGPGLASVGTSDSMLVNRVIGRIDASGSVDTSTRLDAAFSAQSVRSATSVDGTAFWVSGNGNNLSGGVHYTLLGMLGSVQIAAAPNTARFCHVQGGQLYGSAGSAPYTNVFTVGMGTPTAPPQTSTSLPGMPIVSGPTPYSFVFFDRNPLVAGFDTLYVADDRTPANGGGIQKWTFDGMTWTLVTTFNNGITTGARGLAGLVTGNDVTLIATTTNGNANSVVVFVDDGGMSPMATVIATAAMNTVYRGVALSPK